MRRVKPDSPYSSRAGRRAPSGAGKKALFFCCLILCWLAAVSPGTAFCAVCSAPGVDGPASISGIVNSYYAGKANSSVAAGSMTVALGSLDSSGGGQTTTFSAGDLALVMQMQDADINSSNSASYGGSSGGSGYTALNGAGTYEYVVAAGPVSGGSLPITAPLLNSYRCANATGSAGQRRYQVIRVPQYSSATLAGTVTAPGWNGNTGGVVAFDVAGQLNWSGRTIEVSGHGFRGGAGLTAMGDSSKPVTTVPPSAAPNVYVSAAPATIPVAPYTGTNYYNGSKGEGIAGTPRFLFVPGAPELGVRYDSGSALGTNLIDTGVEGYPGGSYSRGAPANAGGGGSDGNLNDNDENTGGGGGGAYSVGGMGGYGWTPNTPPGAQTGGLGGYSVPMSLGRFTMGGGGGAGTTNNGTGPLPGGGSSSGAPGGGIAMVRAATIIGTGTVNVNGASGMWDPLGNVPSSGYTPRVVCNDAAGGGGAGGAALIFASNGGGSVGALTVNAKGGSGGSNTGTAGCGVCTADNCPHGPGGGGSGGFVALTSSVATINVNGGASGLSSGSPTSTPPYGSSTSSGGYQIYSIPPTSIPGASPDALCYPSLTVTKTTGQANTVQGGTTSYTITVTNQTGYGTATGVTLSDALPGAPSPLSYASTASVTLAGGATRTSVLNPAAGVTAPAWGKFTLPGGASVAVTFVVNIPAGTTLGTYQNPATVSYDDPTRTSAGQTVTPGGTYAAGGTAAGNNYLAASSTQEDVTVWLPATVAKSFNPASIDPGGVSVLTVSVANPNASALSNAAFSDSYPIGLSNTATPGAAFSAASVSAGCLGTIAAPASGGSLGLSFGFVPAGVTCSITVNVTFTTPASYTNAFPAGTFTNNLNVTNLAAASATLLSRPAITKSFSPVAVNNNVNSTMTFSVVNANAVALHAAAFSDTPFPSGLLGGVANGGQLIASGGAITVAPAGCTGFTPTTIPANATSLAMTGGTIPAGTTCTLSLAVKSATTGYYPNTVGGVTSTETPQASPASSAALGVGVITVSESFVPAVIKSGAASSLTFTLANPTGIVQNGGSFSDTLANMQVSAGQTVAGSCTWSTATPTLAAGQTALSFGSIIIPPAGCTVTLTVTSSSAGVQGNATATGVNTSLLSAGPVSNTATLTVIAPPGISKAFGPGIIQGGATPAQISTVTFTLVNPNTIPLTGATFTDTLTSMQVAAAGAAGGTCAGASGNSFSASQTGALTFSGLTIPTGGAGCTVTIGVTATSASSSTGYPNSASGVSSSEANTGASSNSASLVVTQAAALTKGFAPATIVPGGASTISFTLANPSAIPLTGGSFSDTLSGMQINATGAAGGTCSGASGNSFNAAQTGLLTFSGLTLPASPATCTVTVVVKAPAAGSFPNTASGVTAVETPVAGAVSNTATLTVLNAPQISKAFSNGSIQIGVAPVQSSTVTLTLSNPNTGTNNLTNVAFTDTLTNLQIYAAGAAGGTCTGASSNSFSAGQTGVISFSGISINAASSCTVTFAVTTTTISPAGGYPNATSGATSSVGALSIPVGAPSNTAYLSSFLAPTLNKSFSPGAIANNGTSTIIFTLTNPNPTQLTGGSFTDPFPTNLVTTAVQQYYINGTFPGPVTVSTRGTCTGAIPAGGGTAVATITFSGIVIPASGSCTVMVDVTTSNATNYTNTAGGVTTNQTPIAGSGASDTLTVGAVSITKSFNPPIIPTDAYSLITFYLENPGSNVTKVSFSDTSASGWPSGMTVAASPAATNSCGGTLSAASGTGSVTLTGATGSGFGANCTITVAVNISAVGSYNNRTTGVSARNLATGAPSNVATLLGIDKPTITKSFNPDTIDQFDTATVTYTITNPNSVALASATFTDTFANNPTSGIAGYQVASTAFGGTCAGVTGLPAAGASTVTPVIPTLLPGSCTITVPVTSTEATGPFPISYGSSTLTGVKVTLTNSPSKITTTGTAPSIPTLTVRKLPLGVVKIADQPSPKPGSTVMYTISYTNPNLSLPFQSVVITDPVPTYTSFVSASCGPLPASLTSCNISSPAVGAKGTVIWTLGGTLNAQSSGQVYMSVTVD